jgi:hypothetical protein
MDLIAAVVKGAVGGQEHFNTMKGSNTGAIIAADSIALKAANKARKLVPRIAG